MNILLTGATGFIGSAVLQRLILQSDDYVRTYGRRAINSHSHHHIVGTLGENANYTVALADIDVVIHCAALAHLGNNAGKGFNKFDQVNAKATFDLARDAAAAGVKRFIFISSIGVNGCCSQDQAFKYNDVAAPREEYAQSKYIAEQALQHLSIETGMEIVIIRPPLVYGRNAPGNFGKLASAIEKGLVLPLGRVHNKRSFVGIDNLVDLIITCKSHSRAANQIFLVSDDQDISTTELLKMMARSAGKPSRLLPVPISWLRFLAKLAGKQTVIDRLCDNLQVDITHTKKMLGWQPPVSLEEGVNRCFVEDNK